ncbi:hypothetical protein [Kocuria sp. ZOR0020]
MIADVGAQITGGQKRGTAKGVTLIGEDGLVATAEDFDRTATLPQGF